MQRNESLQRFVNLIDPQWWETFSQTRENISRERRGVLRALKNLAVDGNISATSEIFPMNRFSDSMPPWRNW